jgi:heat shock protein HslJ
VILLLLFASVIAAPGQTAPAAVAKTAASLVDTEWQLVEIQSMDDSIGTKRPADPSRYTMRLGADGAIQMRLNCNSARGKWSAEAGSDPSSGHFRLGPLAATRAHCPPPSLDQQITGQAQYVRSYLLKNGRLHLSLMADGGIQVWEPRSAPSALATPDPDLEKAILRAAPSYKRAVVDQVDGTGRGRYVYTRADLNGDGKEEVFVYLLGPFFCGTGGCSLQLFTGGPGGHTLINDFPISRLPVIVSPTKTKGWNDLWRSESGGGAAPSYVRHTFDGKKYIERERIPAAHPPQGKALLSGDITFEKGIPLAPRD